MTIGIVSTLSTLFTNKTVHNVIEVGAQDGETTLRYAETFADARIIAFEADEQNAAVARDLLAPLAPRVELIQKAVAAEVGIAPFYVTSHKGGHSLLKIGEAQFADSHFEQTSVRAVETVSLDHFADEYGLDTIDILQADIQGGELSLLRGADRLLREERISVIVLEVMFDPIYADQPLFWDITDYLRARGYRLHGFAELYHHRSNEARLVWGDATFVSPSMAALPTSPGA